MQPYRVQTEIFEGPLDLLLSLIEKRKLPINDISLAEVTDDFIAHIESREIPLAERAHFVLVASTLLLIKSKSLLPALELTAEETESAEDLERRLKLYKRFKGLVRHIETGLHGTPCFLPQDMRPAEPVFVAPADVTRGMIHAALRSVLERLPKASFVSKAVVEKIVSLEDMIETLTERVARKLSLSFREFSGTDAKVAGGEDEKAAVIVGFLAMLELVKRGMISVTQSAKFGDITMETESITTPRYE